MAGDSNTPNGGNSAKKVTVNNSSPNRPPITKTGAKAGPQKKKPTWEETHKQIAAVKSRAEARKAEAAAADAATAAELAAEGLTSKTTYHVTYKKPIATTDGKLGGPRQYAPAEKETIVHKK